MKKTEHQVNLSSFSNKWYNPGSKLKIVLWYVSSILFFRNAMPFPQFLKKWILRIYGCKIGVNMVIKPHVTIKYPWLLEIGNNVWIGEHVWIDNLAKITISSNVCISQGAMLLCGNHDYKKSTFDLILRPITLEEGVWIGAKAIVCPGVTCHSHAILSVGSVATKDLESYGIYKGNPAIKSKQRYITE